MKLMTHQTILMILMVFSLVLASTPLAAQVYKIVDEDGNVTYTDRPPGEGARPMDLPPLSVIETPVYEKTSRQAISETAIDENKEIPLKTLRRDYRDFAITAPQSEESVWHPQGPVPVAWTTGKSLLGGMKVTIFIDGSQQATTTQPIIPVSGLERGEHTVTAELRDAKNRKVATAKPVTFFILQPGLNNRPRATPRGGG